MQDSDFQASGVQAFLQFRCSLADKASWNMLLAILLHVSERVQNSVVAYIQMLASPTRPLRRLVSETTPQLVMSTSVALCVQ